MRATRIILVAGLLVAGLAAAWPFRHRQAPATLPDLRGSLVDVPLRKADIALEVSPASAASPALGLGEGPYGGPFAGSGQQRFRPDFEGLAPPPTLPQDFAPPAVSVLAGSQPDRRQWQPVRMKLPLIAPAMRRHRVTDGDSLERLAERYLGSPERAAEIFEANRDVLTAADLLPLGRIIRIPPREAPDQLEPAKM